MAMSLVGHLEFSLKKPLTDQEHHGVFKLDDGAHTIRPEEKHQQPKPSYMVPVLYFYDSRVIRITKSIKPSARNELGITGTRSTYLEQGYPDVKIMDRTHAWFDTDTHGTLLDAGQLIETQERRQGLKVACPEENAVYSRWTNAGQLQHQAEPLTQNGYGQYLNNYLSRHCTGRPAHERTN